MLHHRSVICGEKTKSKQNTRGKGSAAKGRKITSAFFSHPFGILDTVFLDNSQKCPNFFSIR